jgi:hypothetical protein
MVLLYECDLYYLVQNFYSLFLTVDCSREETAIWTFFVISSNINKVTIQPAAGYLVTCRLYIVTIVKYKGLLFALAFTELAVRVYGIGTVCGKWNAVWVGLCFVWLSIFS